MDYKQIQNDIRTFLRRQEDMFTRPLGYNGKEARMKQDFLVTAERFSSPPVVSHASSHSSGPDPTDCRQMWSAVTGSESSPLHVLIVEDCEADAKLLIIELESAGVRFDWRWVETEEDYLTQLQERPDIILTDYQMPGFSASRVLELLRESHLDIR